MTKTNHSFERDRWGLVISDTSEAMLKKLKHRMENWDDLARSTIHCYRKSLSLLTDVINDMEAKDVDAAVVQEYQLRRSKLSNFCRAIWSIEHARILLEYKDVIGVIQRKGLKHTLQNWDGLGHTMKWRYRRSLSLLTDVINDMEASDVDATVVKEYQLRRSQLRDSENLCLILSIEHARVLLENKDVIEARSKPKGAARKPKARAAQAFPRSVSDQSVYLALFFYSKSLGINLGKKEQPAGCPKIVVTAVSSTSMAVREGPCFAPVQVNPVVKPNHELVAINGWGVYGKSLDDVVGQIRGSIRPICLAFRS